MSVEERELQQRATTGDQPSIWALTEIARLVDKANEAVRESWELRKQQPKEVIAEVDCSP